MNEQPQQMRDEEPGVYTWPKAQKQFEDDVPDQTGACQHEGVDCEVISVCSQGCNCDYCRAMVNRG